VRLKPLIRWLIWINNVVFTNHDSYLLPTPATADHGGYKFITYVLTILPHILSLRNNSWCPHILTGRYSIDTNHCSATLKYAEGYAEDMQWTYSHCGLPCASFKNLEGEDIKGILMKAVRDEDGARGMHMSFGWNEALGGRVKCGSAPTYTSCHNWLKLRNNTHVLLSTSTRKLFALAEDIF
jgi:hypothetical protein